MMNVHYGHGRIFCRCRPPEMTNDHVGHTNKESD